MEEEKIVIRQENVKSVCDARFIRIFDLQYAEGKHYFEATRRKAEDIVATKSDEEFKKMLPDAVTSFVILTIGEEEAKLLLTYEYRYPTGRFLLSPIAGLLDQKDKDDPEPLFTCAKREVFEESGLIVRDEDEVKLVAPLVFSTPGMTDESNALVAVIAKRPDASELSQDGAEGTECFKGFKLLTKEEALACLKAGRDEFGNFYSAFTWMALTYFAMDMWKN